MLKNFNHNNRIRHFVAGTAFTSLVPRYVTANRPVYGRYVSKFPKKSRHT